MRERFFAGKSVGPTVDRLRLALLDMMSAAQATPSFSADEADLYTAEIDLMLDSLASVRGLIAKRGSLLTIRLACRPIMKRVVSGGPVHAIASSRAVAGPPDTIPLN